MESKEQAISTELKLKEVNDSKDSKPTEDKYADDYYTDVEDISAAFNKVQSAIVDYDNSKVELPYEEAVRRLKKLETSIIHHGMFSPNEDYSEVATENIKYMLIPYYLADVFGRISANRKTNLQLSKIYLDEFIKLVNHYGLLDKQERKKWKEIFDNPAYEPTREDKISQYKETKAMETKIKELEKSTNEDRQREIMTLILKTIIIKAFENVRMANLEIEMQNHREKLEKEKLENPNKKEEIKPIPKMKVWQIEKPEPQQQQNPDLPRMLANSKHGGMCHKHAGELRQEMAQQVFQPGGSQPTMTLAEFAEIEMRNAKESERKMKQAEAEKAKEKNNSSDEEVDTKKQLEARRWDDWKDDNEKGSGNRNGR